MKTSRYDCFRRFVRFSSFFPGKERRKKEKKKKRAIVFKGSSRAEEREKKKTWPTAEVFFVRSSLNLIFRVERSLVAAREKASSKRKKEREEEILSTIPFLFSSFFLSFPSSFHPFLLCPPEKRERKPPLPPRPPDILVPFGFPRGFVRKRSISLYRIYRAVK